ncbi:bifunctional tRNA (5-methylaminomethyl-2-thiouridine)(34)-methyltransferase MnmD/FAD-dependent 5-carboxymethylaminomethyl-2-thiouridine(34) oxidoreductase MnmC [Marinobacterium nitratireducens]|uniref:bifunctional tRNA (5-methylaminomethyl-2-thiouridine)(34)-methyltransferase MnmD/FAD-dependent 5-carboxymethylaminomethyl-2-thiouridine(34) oxidoreductase MnmC n=1 Tax=Marinobacterium nitratireducens TaxID=518897 RepID=UPI001E2B17D9|nr:bifunctional tRNA (5-methylaminomethyl-2-thiouridine)(34)-methyltransferase MnmD/FAD-dependent 5-carboxymethylaminomethyl-2-thiouridine(34) oxidoreductase MnmC [Marinobacterium nitratireducens]
MSGNRQDRIRIEHAQLRWEADTPVSGRFDDIYFNKDGGHAETAHVFLDGNRLRERFAAVETGDFTIAETGFGTGLNFLCARALWLRLAPPPARLHFVSVEKFPLRREDLSRALAHWPEFADGSTQLLAQYPPGAPGFHRLELDDGRVRLTLMLGDAIDSYSQLEARVDAWFLDGFAPAKNPDMWQPGLFAQMARLSHAGTTLATFTAAGFVRRGLQEVGFAMEKAPGFGRKREMLRGAFGGAERPLSAKPWFELPRLSARPRSALVIGGGLAGCSAARSLARRGIRVQLLEQSGALAGGGSGNRQGALYAKLPVKPTTQGMLHASGLHYSHQLAARLLQDHDWAPCGLLQLALNDKEQRRQQQLIDEACYPPELVRGVCAADAGALAGLPIGHPGLYFELGGWVSPPALCHALVEHPLIEHHTDTRIERLQQADSGRWSAHAADGRRFDADTVVIANATAARGLSHSAQLPLKPIRGQVTHGPQPGTLPALRTVVCGDGYIAPPLDGHYAFGATFDLRDDSETLRKDDHRRNLETLAGALPDLAAAIAQQPLDGRVGFRCSTPDYLPIIGPLPVHERFLEDYARLRQDRKWRFDTAPTHHRGLYISVGHGSKGLLTCPLGGELLAAMICDEPLPLARDIVDALNPARFIIKNLIRGSI